MRSAALVVDVRTGSDAVVFPSTDPHSGGGEVDTIRSPHGRVAAEGEDAPLGLTAKRRGPVQAGKPAASNTPSNNTELR